MSDQFPDEVVVENPYPVLDNRDDLSSQVFDGSLERQNELDQLYSREYLSVTIDSDLPAHLKAPVEAAIIIALTAERRMQVAEYQCCLGSKEKGFRGMYLPLTSAVKEREREMQCTSHAQP